MAQSKKVGLIAGGLLVLALAVLGFWQWQQRALVREAVERFLVDLPDGMTMTVGGIEQPFFDDRISLVGIRITYEDAGTFVEYVLDRVDYRGLQPSAFLEGAGNRLWCESAVVSGATIKRNAVVEGEQSDLDVTTLAEYSLKDVRGDFPLIWRATKQHWPVLMRAAAMDYMHSDLEEFLPKEETAAFRELFQAYATMRIGRMHMRDMEWTGPQSEDFVRVSIKDVSLDDYSLKEFGPMSVKGISGAIGNGELTVAELGWDKLLLPEYAEIFSRMETGTLSENSFDVLKEYPIALTNGRLKDVRLGSAGDAAAILSAESLNFSLSMGKEYRVSGRLDGLRSGKALLWDDDAIQVPGVQRVYDMLPETLHIDWNSDFVVREDSEAGRLVMELEGAHWSIRDVGEAELSFLLDVPGSFDVMTPPDTEQWRLKKIELSLTDTIVLDAYLILAAPDADTADPGTLRAVHAATVEQLGAGLTDPAMKALIENTTGFLRKQGNTLRVALNPSEPLEAMTLERVILERPEALGLSSSLSSKAAAVQEVPGS